VAIINYLTANQINLATELPGLEATILHITT
jgi:hypothetical protein